MVAYGMAMTQLLLQMPPEMKRRVEKLAAEWDVSQSSLIRQFIDHGLERLEAMDKPTRVKDAL